MTILDQCSYGAASKKPTMILGHNCDAQALQRFCDHKGGHSAVVQRRVKGEFMTKTLAAYPPDMNRALAEVIAKAIQGRVQQVLILFSGPDDAPENLAACLLWLGITAIQIDIVNMWSCDMCDDACFDELQRLLIDVASFVFAAPPCRTFSLARTVFPGPPVLRSRQFPRGFPAKEQEWRNIGHAEKTKLEVDNLLADRTAVLLQLAADAGIGFMMEHPWPWKEDP